MIPGQFCKLPSRLVLFQNPYDLLFAESSSLHGSSFVATAAT